MNNLITYPSAKLIAGYFQLSISGKSNQQEKKKEFELAKRQALASLKTQFEHVSHLTFDQFLSVYSVYKDD